MSLINNKVNGPIWWVTHCYLMWVVKVLCYKEWEYFFDVLVTLT